LTYLTRITYVGMSDRNESDTKDSSSLTWPILEIIHAVRHIEMYTFIYLNVTHFICYVTG